MNNINLLSQFGQIKRFFGRGVATADDDHVLVTGGERMLVEIAEVVVRNGWLAKASERAAGVA